MYNRQPPAQTDLPSSRQLLRSTLVAAAVAAVLLVTVVWPAEYGKDLTGAGRLLGLTAMGEIKVALAREAAADAAAAQAAPAGAVPAAPAPVATPAPVQAPAPAPAADTAADAWRDELRFPLQPGEGIEIKLAMQAGERARYAWQVEGGVVNHDTHGDGSGRSISYAKGRGVPADAGELVAAFTGHHGWFWRNRGEAPVTVVLRTGGQYSAIKR